MFNTILNYFKDTRVEMKKVNWPTRRQTIRYTIVVIAVSLGVAAVLGAFDYVFAGILQLII